MPSIFDFDQTISIKHTFPSNRLEVLDLQCNHYELGKEHALVNIKKQTDQYLIHDNDSLSAIATWHNNPGYIAGFIATQIGKELTLEKTTTSGNNLFAVNQYNVAGLSKPFLISYIPHLLNDFAQSLKQLGNKNQQIALLHQIMLEQQLIQDDTIIDFYEDTVTNYQAAIELPYLRSHLVDRTENFNILETKTMPTCEITPVEPENNNKWETAGSICFFAQNKTGQETVVKISENISNAKT